MVQGDCDLMPKQIDKARMTDKLHKAQLRLLQAEVALQQAIAVADPWEHGQYINGTLSLVQEAQTKLDGTVASLADKT